jgi:hypothetical protein
MDAADLPPLDSPAPLRPASAGIPTPLVRRLDAATGTSAAPPPPTECRPYTSTTTLSGREAEVQGIACRDRDGQWHLVSETPPR